MPVIFNFVSFFETERPTMKISNFHFSFKITRIIKTVPTFMRGPSCREDAITYFSEHSYSNLLRSETVRFIKVALPQFLLTALATRC